jgi:hypothetical protein
MTHDEADIRPETYALDALIRETIARGRRGCSTPAADALLFLGNWHHAFPALVVEDPVLEPVDKLVWMVVYRSAHGTGSKAVFPSYADIARRANVSSSSTVSRAIAILRATRWLSLCARSRDANGRFAGNVYALHDEPLPLADALHLDPGYMAFLQDSANHHHARVRRVAAAVSESLDKDIQEGRDVLAPVNPIERRLEAVQAIRQGGDRRYFAFNGDVLASLSNKATGKDRHDRGQYSKTAATDPQNSKSVPRSSSKYKITTTTTQTMYEDSAREAVSLEGLVLPPRLKDNQRALAARYLATISAEQRQSVLDELAGRLEAEQRGAKPVYDELRYLHHLCRQVNQGGFVANLGLKVQTERDRRHGEAKRLREEAATRTEERKATTSRSHGESALAEIRKQLKVPPARGEKPR